MITGVGATTYTGPENSPSTLTCGPNGTGASYSLGLGSPYTSLVNANSGTVTIPTTCAGMPVVRFGVTVVARGFNGELAYAGLAIQ